MEHLLAVCRATAPADTEITSDIVERRHDVLLKMTHISHPERAATVTGSTTGWFDLMIDGGFGIVRPDDLASEADVREYIADLVALGVHYLHNGAEERRSKAFRMPMRALGEGGGWERVAQLAVNDQWRLFWRRLRGARR